MATDLERAKLVGNLKAAAMRPYQEERDADRKRHAIAASVLDRRYPKVAEKIRAGMRSSTWPEDLVDPGLLLDVIEQLEAK